MIPSNGGAAAGLVARSTAVGLAIVLVIGFYVRLRPVVGLDFPLNDGGLFFLMTEELRQAHYALPAFTSYNGGQIPFAYPPLAFYLAGLIADVTGASLVDVVRLLPAVVSALTVPAFYLLSRAVLGSAAQGTLATLAFALLPRTFKWFVMGGGLTRAPGFLFAILMLHQAYLLYARRDARFVVSTAAFGSLAVLSHLENSWFAVYSGGLLFLFFGRGRRGLAHSLLVVAGVLVLTAPWWGIVVAEHGVTPFLSAAQGGGYAGNFSWGPIKRLNFTDEPQLTLFGVLGVLGAFVCIAQRQWFLPIWLAAIFFVNPRNPQTVAAVPLAMLVGVALGRLIVPGIVQAGPTRSIAVSDGRRRWTWGGPLLTAERRGVLGSLLASALLLAFVAAYALVPNRNWLRWDDTTWALSPDEREAMRWIDANTPRSSTVLVMAFAPT